MLTHISYCQFHAFAMVRVYMLHETVFIQNITQIFFCNELLLSPRIKWKKLSLEYLKFQLQV